MTVEKALFKKNIDLLQNKLKENNRDFSHYTHSTEINTGEDQY